MSDARMNDFAILCLTTNPYSVPLWTYYGGNTSGICVGLRLSQISDNLYGLKLKNEEIVDYSGGLLPAYKVSYSKNIPSDLKLDTWRVLPKSGFEFLFNKPEDLKHEREMRIVIPREFSKIEWPKKNFIGCVYHLEENIESIYLGPSISKENIEKITELIHTRNMKCYGAKLFQIKCHWGRYAFCGKRIFT